MPSPQTEREIQARQLAQLIASIKCPTIMLCSDSIIGQGFEISLSTDIRICSSESIFQMPQLYWNQLPLDGGTQRLPRIVGQGRALELLLTGRTFDASEAKEIGLVQYVSCCDSLDLGVDVAHRIISNAPISVKYIKESVKSGLDMTLNQGLVLESDLSLILQSTKDRSEGLGSFFDKRTPKVKGQ